MPAAGSLGSCILAIAWTGAFGISVMTAWVVSTMPAMEQEFMRPERVTFLGSMTPPSIMLMNSPDMAL